MKPKQTSELREKKPVMKTVSVELPGGFILQHQEPDGENYYTEEMINEAIKELTEPYIKEALTTAKQEWVRETVEKLKGMKRELRGVETRRYGEVVGMEYPDDAYNRAVEKENKTIQNAIKVVEEGE